MQEFTLMKCKLYDGEPYIAEKDGKYHVLQGSLTSDDVQKWYGTKEEAAQRWNVRVISMDIPKPIEATQYAPCSITPFFGTCGCFNQPKEKTDCYFYEEVQDMGAHIPTCGYHHKLGYCPCEECKKYIHSGDVLKGVRDYVDKRGDNN